MTAPALKRAKPLDPAKFRHPAITAKGEQRASVALKALNTLWLNTGTLCNLTCRNCYIESSPTNDRLAYLTAAEARAYFDEIAAEGLSTEEIGFTGGEPFMNPDLTEMLEDALGRGFRALVLTNAMKPMMKCADRLLALNERYGDRLTLRVSVDHYAEALHQIERGARSWDPTMLGLDFLVRHGFSLRIAGRTVWGEDEHAMRAGYQRLFDALVYLSLAEAEAYFDEAAELGTRTIGFTGGEPFMNPDMIAMMRAALARGFDLLVLTNAMRPMRRFEAALAEIAQAHGDRVVMRVSLDHWGPEAHEAERGSDTWDKALDGLVWLARAGFRVAVAGRRAGDEAEARAGYAALLARLGVEIDHLVLFPTMDASADVPEISEGCWDILHVSPAAMMCASSRMVVKAKGARRPHVVACTLLPHDERFALGETLAGALAPVALNHPHCARFCVLGGASCSG